VSRVSNAAFLTHSPTPTHPHPPPRTHTYARTQTRLSRVRASLDTHARTHARTHAQTRLSRVRVGLDTYTVKAAFLRATGVPSTYTVRLRLRTAAYTYTISLSLSCTVRPYTYTVRLTRSRVNRCVAQAQLAFISDHQRCPGSSASPNMCHSEYVSLRICVTFRVLK
jgi:hypothetical protein